MPERIYEQKKIWSEANKEKMKEYMKKYRIAYKEKISAKKGNLPKKVSNLQVFLH